MVNERVGFEQASNAYSAADKGSITDHELPLTSLSIGCAPSWRNFAYKKFCGDLKHCQLKNGTQRLCPLLKS